MISRIKHPLLALALSMTGCEFIGPQIHTKLPLPPLAPAVEEAAILPQDTKIDEAKKTTKVEIFSNLDANQPSQSFITPTEKQSSGAGGATTGGGKGEYSLNFDDADLGEVAKVILSDILGRNYTLSPQVTGKVTLQTTKPLTKDELLPTLDMLLNINNAAMINQNGLYVIKPSNEAVYSTSVKTMGAGYQMRVIPVRNVSANEVAEIIKPLLPEKGLLQVDPKRNLLVAAGSSADLNHVMEMVAIFDTDVMKGRSFAMFTPVHADATVIIEELEQIFNDAAPSKSSSSSKKEGGKEAKEAAPAPNAAASSSGGFYRFIEIDRLNSILAIAHRPQDLHEIETWVLRLDKSSGEGKGGVNVYKVQHHPAMALANTLNIIFGTRQQSQQSSIASGRSSMGASNSSGMMGGFGGSSSGSSSGIGGGIGGSSGLSSSNSGFGSSGGGFGNSGFGNSGFGGAGGFGNTNNVNTLGGMTGGMGQQQALLPNVKIIADESNNALIIVGNAQEYATVTKVLKQLDVLPNQVLIDATVVEVDLKDSLQYGIEWYLSHGHDTTTGGGSTSSGLTSAATTSALASVATGITTGGFSYLYNSKNIQALLQAQATKNNVNVISSPSLIVLNNGEANILVGDSVPIQTGTVNNSISGGATTINSYTDTGVSLAIKPRVNANGLVLMDIMQSVNQVNTTASSGSSINSPTITKRQIQTNVAVQSGETVVLGGMIQEKNTNNTNGVPWLHEIPYIGSLFGGTDREKNKTELVLLLTPRVMKSRQDAQDVTEEFKRKLTGIYDETARPVPAAVQ